MRNRSAHLASRLFSLCGVMLLSASCGSMAGKDDASHDRESSRAPTLRQQQRLVQFSYGPDAAFGICTEPACPVITPKTPVHALAASTPMVTPTLPPGSQRLTLRFVPGAITLDSAARRKLDEMLALARKSKKIVIAARTDNVGSRKANQATALARALQVRDYLRRRMPGAANKIKVDARGSCCFIASNETPEGRRANHRVEVVFSLPG
jgi:outer membrane protein OmpA-like peptidoglycan-associated protein